MADVLCFIDTETDGLHHQCKAWEVAIIRRTPDGGTEHHWFLPLDLRHADAFALKMGGFWDRHPVGRKVSGKPEAPCEPTTQVHDAARDIMRLTFGATLVGSNPAFDADVLGRMLRSEGYLPSWSHRLRDVATLASGYLSRDVGGLDGALGALSLPVPHDTKRHTAMADAEAAMRVYDTVMGGASDG